MRSADPTAPSSLDSYARELLDALAGHPEAGDIVLGGGVALSHYLDCWELWREKTSVSDDREGRDKVLIHVERLELQRPLDRIVSPQERAGAAALRAWFRTACCAAGGMS